MAHHVPSLVWPNKREKTKKQGSQVTLQAGKLSEIIEAMFLIPHKHSLTVHSFPLPFSLEELEMKAKNVPPNPTSQRQ